jgi:signal transduction histidine kinase
MAASADEISSGLRQLATALLDDVEPIARRSVARLQELLPGYAEVPADELLPDTVTITRNLIEAVLDPRADPAADNHFWAPGQERIRQGFTADAPIQGWRMRVESVAEEARTVADRLGIPDRVLREFVEATLQWGDLATRIPAQAPHREAQIRELERLATEQAALRRVAELVAREASQTEVFAKVAEEIGRLLGVATAAICRYEPGKYATVVGIWGETRDPFPVGTRLTLDGDSVAAWVYRTQQPVRLDPGDYQHGSGSMSTVLEGVRSAVGSPVVVNGRLWGAVGAAASREEALPAEAESRIAQFTELVATAIANVQAREEVRHLADEQAALRRVATLVAQEVPPSELFGAVAREVGMLFGVDYTGMVRYEPDTGFVARMAFWGAVGEHLPRSTRSRIVPGDLPAIVADTGHAVRVDDWANVRGPTADFARELEVKSSVAGPIVVNGGLWGALAVHSTRSPLPSDTESRLMNFTELVATAIANVQTREEVRHLAAEQAALRRVATLVAQGAPPSAVFDAVAAEVTQVLGADGVTLSRYEPGEEVTVVAHRGPEAELVPPGTRASHVDGESVTAKVWRSKRPARFANVRGAPGAVPALAQKMGARAAVGAPIVVDGRLWGVAVANWRGDESPPAETEERMAKFAELLDTAIANADSRDQLTASRARLVTEADEARRRVVRDLHDGAQQRLVHTIVTLKHAQRALHANDDDKAESLLAEALERAQQGNAELHELAHGILPAVLTQGGLRRGVNTLVSRLDLAVEVDIPDMRFPAEIEASAYFVVAEALTNVVKHAQAGRAEVKASVDDCLLHVEVRDDGVGGVDPHGHGLVGLADRVSALGGRLEVRSPPGAGTLLSAALPLSMS